MLNKFHFDSIKTATPIALAIIAGIFGLTSVSLADDCRKCHQSKYNNQAKHSPIREGLCDVCHEVAPEHLTGKAPKAVKTDNSADTCNNCHDAVDGKPTVHAAIRVGDNCSNCHDAHGTERKALLRNSVGALCLSCHEEFKGKSVHGPVKDKNCTICHVPHSSTKAKLLEKTGKDLCFQCHNQVIKVEKRVIPNIKEKIDKAASKHSPVEECDSCHSPHASSYDWLALDSYPAADHSSYFAGDATKPNTYALCFNCHDTGLLKAELTDSDTGFRQDYGTGPAKISRNLHLDHVSNSGTTTGSAWGKSCKLCHDPHGGDQPLLIKSTVGPYKLSYIFKKEASGGTCLKSCHGPRTYRREP